MENPRPCLFVSLRRRKRAKRERGFGGFKQREGRKRVSQIHSIAMAALQYLESLRAAHPELAEWYNSLADLYQRKLWHQLTLKLEQFVALAVFQACSPIFLHFLSLILFFLSMWCGLDFEFFILFYLVFIYFFVGLNLGSGDLEGDGGFWDLRSITTWGIKVSGCQSLLHLIFMYLYTFSSCLVAEKTEQNDRDKEFRLFRLSVVLVYKIWKAQLN